MAVPSLLAALPPGDKSFFFISKKAEMSRQNRFSGFPGRNPLFPNILLFMVGVVFKNLNESIILKAALELGRDRAKIWYECDNFKGLFSFETMSRFLGLLP